MERYCLSCKARREVDKGIKNCPECGDKLRFVSKYEWNLIDALDALLTTTGREFNITEQYVLRDRRGFDWYWDLLVEVDGHCVLIDVRGRNSKDNGEQKYWEAFYNREGWKILQITADECTKNVLGQTVARLYNLMVGFINSETPQELLGKIGVLNESLVEWDSKAARIKCANWRICFTQKGTSKVRLE